MSIWRRLSAKPSGAIPGALFTRIGVAALALLCGLLILTHSFTGGEEEAEEAPAQPADLTVQRRAGARLAQLADRVQQRRALEARQQLRQRERLADDKARRQPAQEGHPETDGTATLSLPPDQSGDPLTPPSEAELQLREQLRLEDLRRQHDSLRSEALAHSYRDSEDSVPEARTRPAQASGTPGTSLSDASQTPEAVTKELAGQLDRLHVLAQAATQAALQEAESLTETASGAPATAASRLVPEDEQEPKRVSTPDDPEGFERIYEGSFLEAVLATQLSGDFPGPVLAQVSLPFYSQDRQQVLIPRGSRVIGTAQAVVHQDQSRLAVSFHRLVLPSGHWIDLEFAGLNQVGETALKDWVDRHYLSMFAAAGAVGVLAGLTLQGSHPYAGGTAGFRAGAGTGLGTASTQILERFLNRFPEITIRAGHRLRIWFTSDVLVARPTERNVNP